MRILHVVPYYIPAWRYGGPAKSVHGLCCGLAKLDHEVHVYTTDRDGSFRLNVPLETPVEIDGVKVWYFRSRYPRRLFYSPSLKKTLLKHIQRFDLVHLHSIYVWPTWAAARIAKKFGVPYVISPRGMLVKGLIERKNRFLKSIWIRLIDQYTLEKATGIHATTELEAREIRRFQMELPNIFVVPNGVDDEIVNDSRNDSGQQKISNQKPLLLFLGRISWKKGLDRLIPALAYLPKVSLVIAGNDEENHSSYLEKLARAHKVGDRVNFVGPVYDGEKVALLKSASIFVLPSYGENFGNAVLEAMAVGCPVVVTPQVGLADAIQKAGAGFVVDGDPKTLGESIKNLISDPKLLETMGKAGRKVATEEFTWDRIAKRMENVYREALNHRNDRFPA